STGFTSSGSRHFPVFCSLPRAAWHVPCVSATSSIKGGGRTMKLEMTLCTALAALTLGIGAVQAQDDRRVSADAERDDLMLTERREELLREADEAIDQLRRENESAAELLDAAYGHAVFHTTKGGLILTGAGGTGVARANDGTDVTFMRLGAAGIGLG